MNLWQTIALIAAGGAFGAVSRYALSGGAHYMLGDDFPHGTFVVNVLGCFLLGILAGALNEEMSPAWRATLGVGFLGALTTFSTFGFETIERLEKGHYGVALASVAGNLVIGFAAVWIGLTVARTWWPN